MDKRKGYSLGNPDRSKDKDEYTVGYYDNGTYVSGDARSNQGVNIPSTRKDPSVEEPHIGTFQPNISETGSKSSTRRSSSNRKYILIGVVLITIIVAIIVAAAVVAILLLTPDNDSSSPETDERTVFVIIKGEATLNSKIWTDAFNNKTSVEYKKIEGEFVVMMDKTLQNSSLADIYNRTIVTDMRPGSVRVEFDTLFMTSLEVIDDDTTQTFDGGESDDFDLNIQVDLMELQRIITDNELIDDVIVSDYDECRSYPCQNEGTCNDGVNKFTCTCKFGYIGMTCEEEDNCQTNSCENGSTCRDDDDDYTCECMPGYTGIYCGEYIDECVSGPCENGGTCEDIINSFHCYCPDGFTGDICQINIDDCDGNLCIHGNCVDELNGYSCLCDDGWTGDYCKEDYNECKEENPCQNLASCQNIDGSYICACRSGWAGHNCDININECELSPSPCQNGGTCIDTEGNYKCICLDDWEGSRCEIDFQNPTSNPTTNTTTTTRSLSTYKTTTQDSTYTVNTTSTGQPPTSEVNCGTADKFVYQIDGVIMSSYDTNLDNYTSPQSVEKAGWLMESMLNATSQYGLLVCDLYLKGFYPVDSSSIPSPLDNDQMTGFTLALRLFSSIQEQDIKYIFLLFMSDQFVFTSMIDLQRPTSFSTAATTTYPKETCSNYTSLTTFSFNMTYLEPFTGELFNTVSEAFINLNNTLSSLFLESARNESDDQWICIISLIKCVPTSGNFSIEIELFISVEVRISVPVNTLTIHEAAYHFSQAALKSGILFLIDYRVYNGPETTSRTTTSSLSSSTTTMPSTTTQLRTVPPNDCKDNEYPCLDGNVCIPAYYVCDGYKDCSENEDERGCDCPETYCKFDGDCISEKALCDGVLDCKDQTDEQGCPVVCTSEQFTCGLIKECINMSLKCDNKKDCKDGTDEWYGCSPQTTTSPSPREYEFRLMNRDTDTTGELYGRVEVRLMADGKPISDFGTICDDSWDKQEAVVLCRNLGASDPLNSYAYSQARFGEGNGPIWLRNFHCKGDEQRLEDCVSSEWGQAHCSHHQDASISCGVDRQLTTTSTSSPLSTSNPTPLPITSPVPGIGIRLVGGENCLEGIIEVFLDGKWGTICNTGFGYMEAHVACKILGFSTYKTFNSSLNFEYDTGPIHLSNLKCNGFEKNISECEYNSGDEHSCSQRKYQSIRCLGDPDIDCKTIPDIPNVNCTFDMGRCAYQMEKLSGDENWWWTISSAVGITDTTNSSSSQGRLMNYQNVIGSEGDKARLVSPSFISTSTEMRVEFYYQLHDSSYSDLTLSIYDNVKADDGEENGGRGSDGDEALVKDYLWNSQYLRRDQEKQWLYECVKLSDLKPSFDYSLVFTTKHGPSPNSLVALDEILVSEGNCSESLLDEMCTFDRPRSCGMTVDCLNCDRTKPTFSWTWTNNGTNRRFMMANSAFGSKSDESVMSFAVPSLDTRRSINFLYKGIGENKGHLEISLNMKETFHSTLMTMSATTNSWSKKCIQVPADIGRDVPVTLIFKVIHGGGDSEGFIAVDNVNLSPEDCSSSVSTCTDGDQQCGWTIFSNGPFEWKYVEDSKGIGGSAASNIRLVDGPEPSKGHVEILHNDVWGRVCDDGFGTTEATVVCRMLGYPTQKVEYLEESPYGYSGTKLIWLDELSCTGEEESIVDCNHDAWGVNDCSISEHVAVHCFGESSGSSDSDFKTNFFMLSDQSEANSSLWTSLSSNVIIHAGGEYRLVFDILKAGFELIQIWYEDLARNKTHILDKLLTQTESTEQYCIDFADVSGEIRVGLTAFRLTASTVKTSVANFSLEQGNCKESPADRQYTFERDNMFYGFDVSSETGENVCMSRYEWERVQTEEKNGYFMFVNPLYGETEDTSSITINQITAEASKGLCSLKFSYFVKDATNQRYLGVSVNSKMLNLFGVQKERIWLPGCVSVVDTCGDDPGSLDIKFDAVHVEAGIDDIALTTDLCPDYENATVECNFENGTTCGYIFDTTVWTHEKLLIIVSPDPGRYLVSPLFDTTVDSCVKLSFSSTSEHFVRSMVVNLDGEIVASTEHFVPLSSSREIQQDIKIGSDLRLYFEAYYTNDYVFDKFALTSITLENSKCGKPGLSCDFVVDIECDGECISPDKKCDGIRHCTDGRDEHCECDDTTFHCKLQNECVAKAVQCDSFNDCSDGSDEDNCQPSVSCGFNQSSNFECGYFLHNAEPGDYSKGLRMTSQLAYITSPAVTINNDSCLSITADFSAKSNIRVSSFDGEMFTVLHQESGQYEEITILVNIPVGYYNGFTIETRSASVFGKHVVVINEILLIEKTCEEMGTVTSTTKSSTTTRETATLYFNMTTKEAIIESSTAKTPASEQSTTNSIPFPDDFPVISVTKPEPVELGDHVKLSCYVKHGTGFQLILSWLVDEEELFRNSEFMLEEEYNTKYSIYMSYNNTGTIYDLTVNAVNWDDVDTIFTCSADVVGHWPSNLLNASINIRKTDDGCSPLGDSSIENFCETIGYDKVTTPTVSGFQTMEDVREAFGHLQDRLDITKKVFNDNDQCYHPLHELMCGLYASKCDSGNVMKPICREHCEEISDACMSVPLTYVYDNNSVAEHFCKYLPSKEDSLDCTEIWLGCGANITLGKDSAPSSVRLRSLNYPNSAPDVSPCVYNINTSSAYLSLQLVIQESILADDCNANYIMINEDRLCSSNTSQYTLSSDQTYMKLSLVSSLIGFQTGFLISIKQEYPESLCDVIEVNFRVNIYESKSDSSCAEWVFTTEEKGYSISITFTELLECVDVLDKDSNLIQEVCDLETKLDLNTKSYVKVKSRTSDTNFKLKYSLVSTNDDYGYTITSVELREGNSANEGKVYITRSDGRSGYLCGRINFGASNLICRLAGFGNPSLHYPTSFGARDDINTKDILIYDVSCNENENNIHECSRKQWVDTCTYSCSCYDENDFRGVRCPFKTVQCEFTDYDCGYEYDSSIVALDNTDRFGNGLYMTGSSHNVTEIHSPIFTYNVDRVVTFEYSFEGIPGENLTLTLKTLNGFGDILLWQKPQSTLDGRYRACVGLPGAFANINVQLIFTISMTTFIPTGQHSVGLHNISTNADKCPEEFPTSKCTFNNIDVCKKLLLNTCKDDGFRASVWSVIHNRLEGTSAYALQDKDYSVAFSTTLPGTQSYLRFLYTVDGVGVNKNDLTFRVDFAAGSDDVRTIFLDSTVKSGGENVCLSLPTNSNAEYKVDFVLRKSLSEGLVSLDDIELSQRPCPHPVSCDFEEHGKCNYNIYNYSNHSWVVNLVDHDHTFEGRSKGHVIEVDTGPNLLEYGQPAVFSTPVARLYTEPNKYKCLSFFYKRNYESDASYRLDTSVSYPESGEIITREVMMYIPYVWQDVNIKLDSDKYSKAEMSFKATHLHGLIRNPLTIDDIMLLTTDCIEGLQDLVECDFSNPGLCGFETNCTVNSGYSWRIASGKTNTYDNDTVGHYMMLDSSFGTKGHEAFMWFNVNMKDMEVSHYSFSYYMSGNGTGILRTFYRKADTDTYSGISVVEFKGAGIWMQSECYQLSKYFRGEIFFHAIRDNSELNDIAVDNVKITRYCEVPSVECEFDRNACGYTSVNYVWTLKDGYIIRDGHGTMSIPVDTVSDKTNACIAFAFESDNTNTLIVETVSGLEHKHYTYTVHSNGKQHGQINYISDIDEMKFIVPGNYMVKIDRVTVTSGSCGPISCEEEEFVCPLQCIPARSKCDRNLDCNLGLDEADCDFSLACQFNNGNDCGYTATTESKSRWLVKESHTFTLDGIESTVNGGMLYTNLKGQSSSSTSTVSSTWQSVTGPSCIRFRYLGTVPFFVATMSDRESERHVSWNDTMANMTPTSWRTGQISIATSTNPWMMLTFRAMLRTEQTAEIDKDPFIAIDEIEMLNGTCDSQNPPSCPDVAPLQCDDSSHCYTKKLECDRKKYCPTGSDESMDSCSSVFKIECDFERETLCGYEIISNTYDKTWRRVGGNWYQIPPFDHTRQDENGHFLLFVNWDNNHNVYESTTAISPVQEFPQDGCITFWYYLNSTAVQPAALSAQIMASVNYVNSSKTEYVWYDFVDRPINGWIMGNFEVPGKQKLSVNFTAVTSETYLAYPGVAGLDDISFNPGKCLFSQECSDRTFSCRESGLCVPEAFICDGKDDCRDASDEENCDSRPDGRLQLVGGDGTYGQLQYYLGGSWRAVCFPTGPSDVEYFNYITTQRVCEQLGFLGKTATYEYKLRQTVSDPVSVTCDDNKCSHISCSARYSTTFAGIKCSNSACFSGTKLCPGTADVCRPSRLFCNGNPDCPNNTDETDCCCHEGDEYCTRTPDESQDKECVRCKDKGMFECQSHQCISKDKVCDGHKDCADGMDEYRCVEIQEDRVAIYYESEMVPVCYNDIGRREAETLCSSSGRGLLVNRGIQRDYTEVNGIVLSKSDSPGTILPGLDFGQKRSCYPLVLKCNMPECGTSSIVDDLISPFIPHGNEAVLGARPYHASLRKDDDLHCGCTLIGGQWALTAAHCVENIAFLKAYTVITGSIESDNVGEHGQQFSVLELISHPNYNKDDISQGYDVALIKLAHAPNFDNYTRPACLGTKKTWQYILDLGDKAECYITGFGANELYLARGDNEDKVLAESRVGIITRESCIKLYAATGTGNVSHDGICVENRQPYQAACYGDSGGPLVCRNEIGRWELFGDLSYGSTKCDLNTPAVYLDVTSQRDWIKRVTGLDFQDEYSPIYDGDEKT